jgi:N-acyl-D-aspartate/D-glutamate deacylase
MFGQSHSRGVNMIFSFETSLPFDRLPEWSKLRARPLDEQKRLLRDPDLRKRLVHEANYADYGKAFGLEGPRKPDWTLMRAYSSPLPPHRLVTELAQERGFDPVDLMIELALETDLKQMFMAQAMQISNELLLKTMRHPRAIMTFSDSGAHVSQIIDSSIQTYLIAYWMRTRRDFTLEEAVRMITLAPARAWGLKDRGLLREGMVADINIFDLATLTPCMPEVVNDLPGGARRLKMKAKGFLANIVAGKAVLENGEPTGNLPGQLLRRGRPALAAERG